MSSRPAVTPLSSADEAKVVRALASGPGYGLPYQTEVKLGRRTLCVNAVLWPESDDARLRYASAVARRAEAAPYRLLPVASAGGFDGCHWVAYEIGAAVTLESERGRLWAPEPCLDLLSDVAQGLDEAAAEGLLPYELGPGSIYIDPRFGVLIGDLGTAREAFGNPDVENGVGSTYIPPEVLRGEGAGDRSGVYVCGALLYELLAGAPPRPGPLTQWRPDLSDAIDVVMARALARDSLERYATVAELCQSARRALLDKAGAPPAPAPEPELDPEPETGDEFVFDDDADDAFALAAAPVTAPAEAVADADTTFRFDEDAFRFEDDDTDFERAAAPAQYDFEPPRIWRLGRPGLVVATIVATVAVGAALGLTLGRGDDSPDRAELAGPNGMSVMLPTGWTGGVDDRAALSAYPSKDGFSGLSVTVEQGEIAAEQKTDPVRIGRLDAWRDASEAPRRVQYLVPAATGKVVMACEASPAGGRVTLRACERAVSTLRLGVIRALPLPGVAEVPGFRAAVARLSTSRAAGRRRLQRARRPSGQRDAAQALARAHERSARRFADLPDGSSIAAAARRAAGAYRTLAGAAGSDSRARWNAARAKVRSADRALADAIAARAN